MPFVQPSTIVLLGILVAGLSLLYRWALPRPIPGIPHNASATKSVWGDMPEIVAYKKRHGEVRSWFAEQAIRHRAPLTQAWLSPFSKPVLILSQCDEDYDIFLRRTKEFHRGSQSCDAFHGSIPEHHIAMMSSDPRFKRNKALVRDLMAPSFLHGLSAPQIHAKSMTLIKLWALKAQLAKGRPFEALSDVFDVATDMIMAVAFAFDDNLSTIKVQLDHLISHVDSENFPIIDANGVACFPVSTVPPEIEACQILAEHVGVLFNSLMPRLEDRWKMLTNLRLRRAVKKKNQVISREIDKSLARLERGEASMISAVDHLLEREKAASIKEGRAPEFHARRIYDELLGYVVAGHETSATALTWMIKLLSTHQHVQSSLRIALQEAYASAAAEKRQPTASEIANTSVPYLDATIEESLRYAPPIPLLMRATMVDTTLLGHHVPKGTNVLMPAVGPGYTKPAVPVDDETISATACAKGWATQWDESDMYLFKPERWLRTAEDGKGKRFDSQAGPMITFGLGLRSCFGKRLAYLEMRMMLALFVWNFRFKKPEGKLASNEVHEAITTSPKVCYVILEEV